MAVVEPDGDAPPLLDEELGERAAATPSRYQDVVREVAVEHRAMLAAALPRPRDARTRVVRSGDRGPTTRHDAVHRVGDARARECRLLERPGTVTLVADPVLPLGTDGHGAADERDRRDRERSDHVPDGDDRVAPDVRRRRRGPGRSTEVAVTLRVTGGVRVTTTLRQLVSTVYTPPPGGLALVWTAGGTDPSTVGSAGRASSGRNPTAPTLNLTITVATTDGGFETFVSFDGECDVTIAEASVGRIDRILPLLLARELERRRRRRRGHLLRVGVDDGRAPRAARPRSRSSRSRSR